MADKKTEKKTAVNAASVSTTAPISADPRKHFEIRAEKRLVVSASNLEEVKKAAEPIKNGLQGFEFIFTELDSPKEGVRLFVNAKGQIDQIPTIVDSFEALRALSPTETVAAVKGEPSKFIYIPQPPPNPSPPSVILSTHGGAWCEIEFLEKARVEAMKAMKQAQSQR